MTTQTMPMYRATPGHYTAKAIESWDREFAHSPAPFGRESDIVKGIHNLIKDAQVFCLPGDGLVFGADVTIDSLEGPLRLPFPICALEFMPVLQPTAHNIYADPDCTDSSYTVDKSIVIAIDCESTGFRHSHIEADIVIITLQHVKSLDIWSISPFFYYLGADKIANRVPEEIAAGLLKIDDDKALTYQVTVIENFKDVVDQPNEMDIATSMFPVLHLLKALQVHNIEVERRSETKLNKARVKSGKRALPDHHILTVTGRSYAPKPGKPNGTHASPRQHLRRAHLRHYDGHNTWVNSMIVNPGKPFTGKTYRVKVTQPES